jgi:hypothetical protein
MYSAINDLYKNINDLDKSNSIDFQEFCKLLRRLDKNIGEEEL